jgi:hypothetical protein
VVLTIAAQNNLPTKHSITHSIEKQSEPAPYSYQVKGSTRLPLPIKPLDCATTAGVKNHPMAHKAAIDKKMKNMP